MLDNRTKYKKLTPPAGIAIDGGIMPARDKLPVTYGSWRLLRGEDPCFLNEASNRLKRYSQFGTAAGYAVVPTVYANLDDRNYPNAITEIHGSTVGLRTWPAAPQWEGGGGYIPDVVQYGTTGAVEFLDGCLDSSCRSVQADWMASAADFAAAPLVADNVRKVYHDIRQVACVLGKGYYGTGSGGVPVTAAGGEAVEQLWDIGWTNYRIYTNPYDGCTSILSMSNRSGSTWGSQQTDWSWTVTGVNSAAATSPIAGLDSAELSCWVIFRINTEKTDGNGNYDRHVDAYVTAGTVLANGSVSCTVESSVLKSGAVNYHGLATDVHDLPNGGGAESVTSGLFGVVFYDAAIDFSSLGWEWPQPQP